MGRVGLGPPSESSTGLWRCTKLFDPDDRNPGLTYEATPCLNGSEGGPRPTLIWNDLCQHSRRRDCDGRSPGAERDRRSGSLRRWVNLIFVGYIRCQLQCHILIFRLERPQSTIASPEGGAFLAPRVVAGSPDRAHCRLPLSIPGLRGRTRPQVRQFFVSLPPGSERPR